jgi:hypothetical protein
MTKRPLAATAIAGCSMLGAFAPAFAADAPKVGPPPPQVFGMVTGKGVVTLKNKAGKQLTKLRKGRYTMTVQDLSTRGGFRITGPGLKKATGQKFIGATIWGISLKPGKYTIRSASSKTIKTITVTK